MSEPRSVAEGQAATPLYPRLLRLKHLHPSAWQRALLVEGSVAVGSVAALADQVSAWTPLVLPVAVAVVVKFHDVLTGVLRGASTADSAVGAPAAAAASLPSGWGQEVAPAAAVALPHVVVLRPGQPAPETPAARPDAFAVEELGEDDRHDVLAGSDELDVEVEPSAPVGEQPAPVDVGPIVVSALRTRADLDALTAAALERALDELSRRGGLEPFVMKLDAGGPALVHPDDVLALPGEAGLRAVVVCTDVALPGRAPVDAVRLELEHAHGEPELVTVVYRHTGEGPEVVPCERTRTAGKRSGVRRRFFAKQV